MWRLSQAFVLETLLTFFLMSVILNIATGSREVGALAGIAVGATVAMEALVAGALPGAEKKAPRSDGSPSGEINPVSTGPGKRVWRRCVRAG